MSYPLPEGEDLRRAVRWISAGLEVPSHEPLIRLVEQAIFKFDLSPKDGETLLSFFTRPPKAPAGGQGED